VRLLMASPPSVPPRPAPPPARASTAPAPATALWLSYTHLAIRHSTASRGGVAQLHHQMLQRVLPPPGALQTTARLRLGGDEEGVGDVYRRCTDDERCVRFGVDQDGGPSPPTPIHAKPHSSLIVCIHVHRLSRRRVFSMAARDTAVVTAGGVWACHVARSHTATDEALHHLT